MKFGDKLIFLRKKNGLSQEELASKLNVSRQSVSKWESNNTYPETDKIVQICNLFDCSMDDLINEDITDISSIERKEKSNFNISMDSLLEFITKTVNMFASMKFSSGFKCVVELFIMIMVFGIIGAIGVNISASFICRLISFVPNYTLNIIENMVSAILSIAWFVLTVIVIVHTFKIRYLDYYDQLVNDRVGDDKKEKQVKKKEVISEKDSSPKIVIRDSSQQPFAFLSGLSKFVIWCIKFFVAWILLGFLATLFALVICLVIFVPLSFCSQIFLGLVIGTVAAIVINLLIIIGLVYFIINKKTNIKLLMIIFISAVVIAGIGAGISVVGLKNIEFIDNYEMLEKESFEEKINYQDDLLIINDGHNKYEFIVDDNLIDNEIYLSTDYDKKIGEVNFHKINLYGMTSYSVYYKNRMNFKYFYELFINDLKNNIIRSYDHMYIKEIRIKASSQTINKLLNNISKVYLYDQKVTDKGYLITNIVDRIDEENSYCDASYDALSDTMIIRESNCMCQRENVETSRGNIIRFNCDYKNELESYE